MHNSKFNAGLFSWVWLLIWTTFVNLVTFFIAYPWTMCAMYGWKINNLTVNGYQMRFDGHGHQLFGMWIKWWFFTIITFGIYGFWVPIKLIQWQAAHTFIPAIESGQAQSTVPAPAVVAAPVPVAAG